MKIDPKDGLIKNLDKIANGWEVRESTGDRTIFVTILANDQVKAYQAIASYLERFQSCAYETRVTLPPRFVQSCQLWEACLTRNASCD